MTGELLLELLSEEIPARMQRRAIDDLTGLIRDKLAGGDKCAARAYDTTLRAETCLFDVSHEEAVWLTSSWSCVTHTGALGTESSCFRMCAYDDYCAKHVSCATPDVDLTLCALGVCLPEQRAGL